MSKYIGKKKLVKYLKNIKKIYKQAIKALDKEENNTDKYTLREYRQSIMMADIILDKIDNFNIEPPKYLENSVTAQAIKAEYIEDSAKWLDDEFADKKDEWITEKSEIVLLENDGEFIGEIIEEIINADLPL